MVQSDVSRKRHASCSLWIVSAVDPPVFLYSVFNKRVLKALPSSDGVVQVSNLFWVSFLIAGVSRYKSAHVEVAKY